MSDAPVVVVRGEAVRDVPPEIATLNVQVSARDRSRPDALSRLTTRQETVRGILDGYGPAIEKRETGSVAVYPEIKRGSGEKVIGYTARVSTTVAVLDFAVLGELFLRLAEADLASVYGPQWKLRPDSPAHREARHAAIAHALTRARDYAAALGAEITGLQALADSGLLATAGDRPPAPYDLAGGAVDRAAGTGLDLDPRQQRVYAAVEARFTISPPNLASGPEVPGPAAS